MSGMKDLLENVSAENLYGIFGICSILFNLSFKYAWVVETETKIKSLLNKDANLSKSEFTPYTISICF